MFWGGRLHGSYRLRGGVNPSIRISARVVPGNAHLVVASKSHLNAETFTFIDKLGSTELVQAGSSLKFCKIAEGRTDVYQRFA
jgi:3'(2'), 5'-bisphosphate nucleotidase